MRKFVFALALLAVMGSALPAIARGDAEPVDTDPIGTLGYLPDEAAETPTAGSTRLVVVFADDMEAKGPFGAKFTGLVGSTASGPSVPQMVAYSPGLDGDLQEAGAPVGGPEFAGIYGNAAKGTCPANGGRPQLFAYSVVRTETTVGTPYARQICEETAAPVVISTDPVTGVKTYETTVTKFVPGFWLDFSGTPNASWDTAFFQYAAAYSEDAGGGDFYEPGEADAGGTSTLLDAPGV